MKKIGVALSGGGIRSFSQLPIIKTIKEESIDISVLSGTSMGSVIAGLLACGIDVDEVSEYLLEVEASLSKKKVFKRFSPKILPFTKDRLYGGYVDGEVLESLLKEYLDPKGFTMMTDVLIPLAIPAVDLYSGKTVVFVSHPEQFTKLEDDWDIVSDVPLSLAIRASCSFPFVIGAVEYEGYLLVDGGLKMNLPLDLLLGYNADKKIGITMYDENKFEDKNSVVALANRVHDIMKVEAEKPAVEKADIILNVPLETVQIFGIGKGRETMEMGEQVAMRNRTELSKLIYKDPWYKSIFNKK